MESNLNSQPQQQPQQPPQQSQQNFQPQNFQQPQDQPQQQYYPQPTIIINNTATATATANANVNTGKRVSPKNKWVALILCFFFGWLGIHRFYVGKVGTGILQIFTFGGFFGIWVLIDFIVILLGSFRDANGDFLL
jgi:TM2 domain-containing membrane protein YozV